MNLKEKKLVNVRFVTDEDISLTMTLKFKDNQTKSNKKSTATQMNNCTRNKKIKKERTHESRKYSSRIPTVAEGQINSTSYNLRCHELENKKKENDSDSDFTFTPNSGRRTKESKREKQGTPTSRDKTTPQENGNYLLHTPKKKLILSEDEINSKPSTARSRSYASEFKGTLSAVKHKICKESRSEYSENDSSISESSLDESCSAYSDAESTEDQSDESIEENKTSTVCETSKWNILSPVSKKPVIKKIFLDSDFDYAMDPDEYFIKKLTKNRVSKNKFSKIEIPRFQDDDELDNLLNKEYVKHEEEIKQIFHYYENFFALWMYYLKEGFNLLIYGLGSKINLLNCFHSKILSDYLTITLHGYFPSLTMKEVLSSFVVDIFKKKKCPANTDAALSVISDLLKKHKSSIFLIIHNIDGIAFRKNNYQNILSKLASFSNLHVLATIDHINAPILWGNSKRSKFNFVWLDVTTYQPYLNETRFENTFDLHHSDPKFVGLSSLKEIFRPLPMKAKKIFKIITEYHLDNKHYKHYKGISFDECYQLANHSFLSKSVTVFRVLLTEFIDHKIIKLNNQNYIQLLIKDDVLSTFYEQEFGTDTE